MDNSSITWNHRNPGRRNREARRAAATAFTSRHRAIVDITTAALAALHEPEGVPHQESRHTPYSNSYNNSPSGPSYQDSFQDFHRVETQPHVSNTAQSFEPYPQSTREPTPVQTPSLHTFAPPPANTPVDIQSNFSETLSFATIPDPDLNAAAQAVINSREEEQHRRRLHRAYDSRRHTRTREHRRRQATRRASPAPSNSSRRSLFDRINLPSNNTRDRRRF
ncbi:hypothetical protein P167DRAFT_578168 [Morchella conica CCBAS932]|uniref:Uncharacterized protein n=1 Tax=Morchella conica CCBAS932 TaxID=1392247 RepID=A0A3N4KDL1_9PEZI|nr:hypothetical protein P167DRAFT_578168 [Morchella conica CCBAS932]